MAFVLPPPDKPRFSSTAGTVQEMIHVELPLHETASDRSSIIQKLELSGCARLVKPGERLSRLEHDCVSKSMKAIYDYLLYRWAYLDEYRCHCRRVGDAAWRTLRCLLQPQAWQPDNPGHSSAHVKDGEVAVGCASKQIHE